MSETRLDRHDGWTPEPEEQVQPGDPWHDSEIRWSQERVIAELRAEISKRPDPVPLLALLDLISTEPSHE